MDVSITHGKCTLKNAQILIVRLLSFLTACLRYRRLLESWTSKQIAETLGLPLTMTTRWVQKCRCGSTSVSPSSGVLARKRLVFQWCIISDRIVSNKQAQNTSFTHRDKHHEYATSQRPPELSDPFQNSRPKAGGHFRWMRRDKIDGHGTQIRLGFKDECRVLKSKKSCLEWNTPNEYASNSWHFGDTKSC